MGKFLLAALAIVLVIYAFFDAAATPRSQVRVLPKPAWLVIIVLVPVVGALAWIGFGTKRLRPGPGRPARPPRGPDDDPDYLRGI
ncbi:PLDc N-terminal domain-containing protein [Aeromicrobium alkaliterrae]|uniref:Cardiolipin synthase N-terminal domain-containing protein n=1 Tax=Aeromicrobium alkaliterrae TaxID=302168 RepID=A0ABP4VYU4_9ACTN